MQERKIRTAVIGLGRMGELHSRIYNELPLSRLVAVVDIDFDKAKRIARQCKCKAYKDYKNILDKVDTVTISTPTCSHHSIACDFIRYNIPVLIEKPLAATVKEGREVVNLAQRNNVLVAVGHSERCNPIYLSVKGMDIQPIFIEATRINPYSFRTTDIGVILDLMIHDIDVVLSMVKSPVKKVDAIGANILNQKEDICYARIFFRNGCMASLSASRLALKSSRKIQIFSKTAYLSMDYSKKRGIVIRSDENINLLKWIRDQDNLINLDPLSFNWRQLLKIEELNVDDIEPLRLEQESFLRSVIFKDSEPQVTGEEGLKALSCAYRIIHSLKIHSFVYDFNKADT